MPHLPDAAPRSADDVQRLENVLADTPMNGHTRGSLLKRAAIGAAATAPFAGALTAGAGSAFAHFDSLAEIQTVAATAEALAVTYLTAILEKNEGLKAFPKPVVDVLRAADTAEYDHLKFLMKAGFKPLTRRFWIPNAAFGPKLANVPATIEVAETLFVNAYLIHVTAAAKAHQPKLARYGAEIMGVESEHRTLARSLQGKLPDNLAFEQFIYVHIAQIVGALEGAGFGFGKRGSKPGRFFDFKAPGDETIAIESTMPR